MPTIHKTSLGRYALKLNDLVLGVWSDINDALQKLKEYK